MQGRKRHSGPAFLKQQIPNPHFRHVIPETSCPCGPLCRLLRPRPGSRDPGVVGGSLHRHHPHGTHLPGGLRTLRGRSAEPRHLDRAPQHRRRLPGRSLPLLRGLPVGRSHDRRFQPYAPQRHGPLRPWGRPAHAPDGRAAARAGGCRAAGFGIPVAEGRLLGARRSGLL